MMTKPVVCDRFVEKRKKWTIFQELHETNDDLDEALCILNDLKVLLTGLPNKWSTSVEHADLLVKSEMNLGEFLVKCMESASVHFDEIETKLDEMEKFLLHDETCDMHRFSKLVSEVRCSQKLVDTLIANAEEEIYRFLESGGLYLERRKTDVRIMELVLNI